MPFFRACLEALLRHRYKQSESAVSCGRQLSPLFLPQLGQKFPDISRCPQEQLQVSAADGAGRLAPQLGQKLLEIPFSPQVQSQVPAAAGRGRFLPQFGQKLLVTAFWPQVQSQESEIAALTVRPAFSAQFSTGFRASFVRFITPPMAPSVTPSPAISPSPPEPSPAMPFFIASMPTCLAVSCW